MALLLSDTVGRTVNLATVAKKDSNNIFYLVKKKIEVKREHVCFLSGN